jgi:4-methylaminobutanoate oxidase (formaldehyde-forming)
MCYVWFPSEPVLMQALHRLPILEAATFRQMFNGAEGTTPDGKWILGECPEVRGNLKIKYQQVYIIGNL